MTSTPGIRTSRSTSRRWSTCASRPRITASASSVARFSHLGEHGAIWFAIAAVTRRWDAARTVAIAYGANQLIKVIVRRRRPADGLTGTHSDLSYPSAHAATSVAAVRSLEMPGLWPLAIALAASRLYLRVHYPSDTVAGVALGAAVAELTR
jgi:membrane-associated phospholipid phosphatase